jgi:hypothetical protein
VRDDADLNTFVHTLGEASERSWFRIHGFVLMTKHYIMFCWKPHRPSVIRYSTDCLSNDWRDVSSIKHGKTLQLVCQRFLPVMACFRLVKVKKRTFSISILKL